MSAHLLADFQVHHLVFDLQAQNNLRLGAHAGAQLRGALWRALQEFSCEVPPPQRTPEHIQFCPLCRLFALETHDGARGQSPPRPFTVRPPLASRPENERQIETDSHFQFGINLLGDAAQVFPYIMRAVYRMGEIGLGQGRGQFKIQGIRAVNPLTNDGQHLFADNNILGLPSIPVTHSQIQAYAQQLSATDLTLVLTTPMQLKHEKQWVVQPQFQPFIGRLIERCQALATWYCADIDIDVEAWRATYLDLVSRAEPVRVLFDQTRWISLESYSRRTHKHTAVGGLVGMVSFQGDLTPFLEWLLWGQSIHVGKNTAKGNGWYTLTQTPAVFVQNVV